MSRGAKGEGSLYPYRDGFRAYITVKGKRRYFYFPRVSKGEATAQLRELLNQRDDGTLPRGRDYTVAVWMRHWLQNAKLRPAVAKNYEHNVEHYIVPALGTVKLRELEPEDLERFYADMLSGRLSRSTRTTVDGKARTVKKPLAPRTIINVHSNIRRALTVAMQRGHVGRNVAQLVEPPEAPRADTKSMSVADAHRFLDVARVDRYAARWNLGVIFGMRPGEVLGLEWQHIDFDTQVIRVRQQLQRIRGSGVRIVPSAKTDAGWRDIAVPQMILDMLVENRRAQMEERLLHGPEYVEWEDDGRPSALVFTQANGRPIDTGVDTRRWKKLLDAAGLPHERRYIGRHTAASMMIHMGMAVEVVSSILGHAKTSFTYDTYVHPMQEAKRSAANMLGSAFARKVPDKVPSQPWE